MTARPWTHHAMLRAEEMGVSVEQVDEVVADPDVSYPSKHQAKPCTLFRRGELVVSLWPDGSVATVMWRTVERFERGQGKPPACAFWKGT